MQAILKIIDLGLFIKHCGTILLTGFWLHQFNKFPLSGQDNKFALMRYQR